MIIYCKKLKKWKLVRICKRFEMEKKFEFGLVLGRFHPMHNGHKEIIDMARQLCKKTLILVSSAQESGTLRNPFKIETRKKVIQKIYQDDDVIIGELDDLTNENDISFEWGRYILDNVEKMYGVVPDLMVYGKDESRKGWFSEEDSKKFSEVIVARNKIEISATTLREYLVQDKKEMWQKYVPEQIWDMYEELREELSHIEDYKKA